MDKLKEMAQQLFTQAKQDPSTAYGIFQAFKAIGIQADKVPLGSVKAENGNIVITSWDNKEGKIEEPIIIPEGQRSLVCGPETNVKDFLIKAFGKTPKLVIGPIGWTVPSLEALATINPDLQMKFDKLEALVKEKFPADQKEKKLKKAKQAVAAEYYQTAFDQWWKPIHQNLDQLIKAKGLNRDDIVMLTSASYEGVDKAAMDYAADNAIKIANTTPFCYAKYMSKDPKQNHPLLITNSVKDYADVYAEGADIVLMTGGREHALKEDIQRALIGRKAKVIAADIMKEVHGLTVPATWNGNIENAAAYMLESGLSVANMALAQDRKLLTGVSESQSNAIAVLEKLFNRITIGDPQRVLDQLQ